MLDGCKHALHGSISRPRDGTRFPRWCRWWMRWPRINTIGRSVVGSIGDELDYTIVHFSRQQGALAGKTPKLDGRRGRPLELLQGGIGDRDQPPVEAVAVGREGQVDHESLAYNGIFRDLLRYSVGEHKDGDLRVGDGLETRGRRGRRLVDELDLLGVLLLGRNLGDNHFVVAVRGSSNNSSCGSVVLGCIDERTTRSFVDSMYL